MHILSAFLFCPPLINALALPQSSPTPDDLNRACGESTKYPTLQSSYTFSPDDNSPFCVDISYAGCDYRYTDELRVILNSDRGTDTCGYIGFGPSTPKSGQVRQCCPVQHNNMNQDSYQFRVYTGEGYGTASPIFSVFTTPTGPRSPRCKSALEHVSVDFRTGQTDKDSSGFVFLRDEENTYCEGVRIVAGGVVSYGSGSGGLEVARCEGRDLTGSTGGFGLSCTSTRNDPRPINQVFPVTVKLNLQGTQDGSSATATIPGTVTVVGRAPECAQRLKLVGADVKKSEVAANSFRIPVNWSSDYCNNQYQPHAQLYSPNTNTLIADCIIAKSGAGVSATVTYATCKAVNPGGKPFVAGTYDGKAVLQNKQYNLGSVTYRLV